MVLFKDRLSSLLIALSAASSFSSTTEERKAAYRNAVLSNYDETTTLSRCVCSDNTNPPFPPPPDCGVDLFGDNYFGTNSVDGFNPGIAVFPYSNLPIPNEDEALENLFCRTFCDKRTTGDFTLTILMRTMYHGDEDLQSKIVSRLQENLDSGELRLWQAPGEDHNM